MNGKVDTAPVLAAFGDSRGHIGKTRTTVVRTRVLIGHAKRMIRRRQCRDVFAGFSDLYVTAKEIRIGNKE
jgi:hypothetical protein